MCSKRLAKLVYRFATSRVAYRRQPDLVIGSKECPYLLRWCIIPRNRWLNIYLHQIIRSDDDRALHDHPWWNLSFLLYGSYVEHTINAGGIEKRVRREAGTIKVRSGRAAHRLEIDRLACWTLFLTGPRLREWGFHCPRAGWVHWQDFTDPGDKGLIGRGCGEMD